MFIFSKKKIKRRQLQNTFIFYTMDFIPLYRSTFTGLNNPHYNKVMPREYPKIPCRTDVPR